MEKKSKLVTSCLSTKNPVLMGVDEQPLTKLNSEEIDFRAASEQFNKIKHLTHKDLETLEILIDYQGKKVPTVAGIILFGKNRAKLFPDAWIQAGRFNGIDKSSIIDNAEFHIYPINAIEEVIKFIEKHAMQSLKIDGIRHQKLSKDL